MPSLQGLLQRWGFVRLRRYGLELTPDGRILSTRPVLDDGTGGRIVGWRDGDPAISKLSSWKGERSEPSVVVDLATPVAMPQPAALPVPPAPALSARPEPVRPSAAVMPVDVAAGPTVDEDDWEWTIALARARTAAGEDEAARHPDRSPPPPAAATAPPASREWRDDSRVPTRPPRAIPPTTTPSTVIPVPALPTMATAGRSRMEPVVRAPGAPAAASRFAKGTGPVDPPTARLPAMIVEDTLANLSVGDRTQPGIAMPPATRRTAEAARSSVGDRTKPGIALPPAARAVQLPSIKRRTSPR